MGRCQQPNENVEHFFDDCYKKRNNIVCEHKIHLPLAQFKETMAIVVYAFLCLQVKKIGTWLRRNAKITIFLIDEHLNAQLCRFVN